MKRFIFNKYNKITLISAIILTVIGYIIMGTGDNTISTILLIIAYVALFPISIVIGFYKADKK